MKNHAIRSTIRVLLFVVDRAPPGFLFRVGSLSGRLAHRVFGGARKHACRRIAASLPGADAETTTRACFENAGKNLALSLLLRRPGVRAADYVALPDASRGVLDRALAGGRGAIVVSAHIGPFEMVPALLVESGFSPSIVVRESYDPKLDRVADAHRRGRGVDVIHRGHEHAALRVVRALRGGRPVGILPDVGGRGVAATAARFLGRSVAFPASVERLATRVACPIVVGTLASTLGKSSHVPFELRFELLDEGLEASGRSVTQCVADAVTRAILRTPEHWLWMAPPHLAIADDSSNSLFSGVLPSSELGPA